jgi:hypothetical protein
MYTLYIKTHKITGLKYLGKTKQDPFKYSGSGIDWTQHLKKYGNCHDTEIVFQSEDWDLFKNAGRHYSEFYHIVTASDDFGNKIWANKIPETGAGPGWSSSQATEIQNRPSVKIKKMGGNNPIHRVDKSEHSRLTVDGMNRPEVKQKISGKNNYGYDHIVYKFVRLSGEVEKCTFFELRKKYGLHHGHLREVINGHRKSHKGWSIS